MTTRYFTAIGLCCWLHLPILAEGFQAADSVQGEAVTQQPETAVSLPSLRTILDGYYRENGGRIIHEKLRSFRIVGKLLRNDQTFHLWIFRKYPNRFRIIQASPEGRNIFGYDGKVFWRGLQRQGRMVSVEVIDTFDPLELAFEADFHSPLLTLRRMSRDLKVVGAEEFNGRKAFVVEGLVNDEATIRVWVDAEHFQEVYLEFVSEQKRFRVEFSDHRKVGDYWFAYSILNVSVDGSSSTHIIVDEVTLNPGLFDTFFSPDFLPQ
jgi:hypothetical protein